MVLIALLLLAVVAHAQTAQHILEIIPNPPDSALGKIRLYENRVNGTNYLELVGQTSLTTNPIVTVPSSSGNYTLAGLELPQVFTGSNTFSATNSFLGTITTRAAVPGSDNTYDFGTSGLRYRTAYLGTSVLVHSSSINRFEASATNIISRTSGGTEILNISSTFSTVALGARMDPTASGTIDLGQTLLRYREIHSDLLSLGRSANALGSINFQHSSTAGTATLRAANVTASVDIEATRPIYPSATNSFDLGLATRRWNVIYGNTIDAGTGFRVTSANVGTSTGISLSCGAGTAVKNLTITPVGGILTVVSGSCGAP